MTDNINSKEYRIEAIIDKAEAIALYDGDEKMYENVLESFAKNNRASLDILKSAIYEENIVLAHRTAHSLRGSAGLIGASRLASASLAIEEMLACMMEDGLAGEISVASDDKVAAFVRLLEEEFEAVFNVIDVLGFQVESADSYNIEPGNVDRIKAIALMDKLAPYLAVGDTKCLEYMDEVEEVLRPAAEIFRLFITQMENYDFEQAYETLNKIHRFLIP